LQLAKAAASCKLVLEFAFLLAAVSEISSFDIDRWKFRLLVLAISLEIFVISYSLPCKDLFRGSSVIDLNYR